MQDNFLYATHVHYFGYQGKGNNSDDSTDRTTASQDQEGQFISDSEQIIFTAPNKSPKVSVLAIRCQDIGGTVYTTTGGQDIPMFVKVYVGKGKVGYGPRFLLAVVPVTIIQWQQRGGDNGMEFAFPTNEITFTGGHVLEAGESLYARFENIVDASNSILGDGFVANYQSGSVVRNASNKRVNMCVRYYVHDRSMDKHLNESSPETDSSVSQQGYVRTGNLGWKGGMDAAAGLFPGQTEK